MPWTRGVSPIRGSNSQAHRSMAPISTPRRPDERWRLHPALVHRSFALHSPAPRPLVELTLAYTPSDRVARRVVAARPCAAADIRQPTWLLENSHASHALPLPCRRRHDRDYRAAGAKGKSEGLPAADETVLRLLPEGDAGAEVDDGGRSADEEGWPYRIAVQPHV